MAAVEQKVGSSSTLSVTCLVFFTALCAQPKIKQVTGRGKRLDETEKADLVAALKNYGAVEVKDAKNNRVAWQLKDGPRIPAGALRKALEKQQKIAEGKFKPKPRVDEEVPPALNGWEVVCERKSGRTALMNT